MIFNTNAPETIERALARAKQRDGSPLRPSELLEVVDTLEAALLRNERSDRDPIEAGWPPEIADALYRIRRVEEQAVSKVRSDTFRVALERRRNARAVLVQQVITELEVLRQCYLNEDSLFARMFWLDLGGSG